jgi:hypothetical protein
VAEKIEEGLYKVEKFAAQLHRGAEGIGGGLGGGRDS